LSIDVQLATLCVLYVRLWTRLVTFLHPNTKERKPPPHLKPLIVTLTTDSITAIMRVVYALHAIFTRHRPRCELIFDYFNKYDKLISTHLGAMTQNKQRYHMYTYNEGQKVEIVQHLVCTLYGAR
jgi:hypothetical protein